MSDNEGSNQSADQPLRLVSISEDGNTFELDKSSLAMILEQLKILGATQLSVVSVVGAFRTGKSFLLSCFLKYLRHCEKTGVDHVTDDSADWLLNGGNLLQGNQTLKEGEAEPGFLWRSGQDRMTTGIWVYGRPFLRSLPGSKEKVAVLLMDTQGMFDSRTTTNLTAAIFGLSTLISSYQVYNLAKQIQEDNLQQLHFFTEFSKAALKAFSKKDEAQATEGAPESGAAPDSGPKPFQTMEFLVRDWQNFADEDDIPKCLAEMPAVLDKAFHEAHVDDAGTRDQIRDAFTDILCFLLPHPGVAMTKTKWQGDVTQLEPNFVKLLDHYVRATFEKNLVSKQINGRVVTPVAFSRYIEAYGEVFKNGQLPKTSTLVEAISSATNLCAKDEGLCAYKQGMLTASDGAYVQERTLRDNHAQYRREALAVFHAAACFGAPEGIADSKDKLDRAIAEEFQSIQERNKLKMHEGLHKYIIPIMAAVLAFMLDWISDYTCDSWSDTCRKLSFNFALFYYILLLVLLYEFYAIFKTSGGAAVGMGAMALGQAVIERGNSLMEQIKHHGEATKVKDE